MPDLPRDVSLLLGEIRSGDSDAWDALFSRVYDELRRLAHQEMSRERPGHVLQTTALVNEAYLRLVKDKDERWRNRSHFFSAAASAMRRILVDEARRRKAVKRGGSAPAISLDRTDFPPLAEEPAELEDVEAVHLALEKLEATAAHRSKGKVVELRFFVGLTIEETAEVVGLSPATIKRDWDFARAWLRREIERSTNRGA